MKISKRDTLKVIWTLILMASSVDGTVFAALPTGSTSECPPSTQGQQATPYAIQASSLIDKMVPAPTASAINTGAQSCFNALKNIQNIGFQSGLTFVDPSTLVDMACGYLKNKESSFINGLIPGGGLNFDPNSLVGNAVTGVVSGAAGYLGNSMTNGFSGSGAVGGGSGTTIPGSFGGADGTTVYNGRGDPSIITNLGNGVTLVSNPQNGNFYNLKGGTVAFPVRILPGYNNLSASYSSTNPVQKIAWLSSTPGGPAVGSRLLVQGYQNATMLYSGVSSSNPNINNLELPVGAQYYLNVRNATKNNPTVNTCPGDCPFVLGVPNAP